MNFTRAAVLESKIWGASTAESTFTVSVALDAQLHYYFLNVNEFWRNANVAIILEKLENAKFVEKKTNPQWGMEIFYITAGIRNHISQRNLFLNFIRLYVTFLSIFKTYYAILRQ